MNRMVLHSRVGPDGVLHITVPIGKEDADREVQVTIDPVRVGPTSMTQEEWREVRPDNSGQYHRPVVRAPRARRVRAARGTAVTHLLDTNSCVDHLRRGPASNVTARLAAAVPGSVVLCSVVVVELLYGAHRSVRKGQTLSEVRAFCRNFRSLAFDDRRRKSTGGFVPAWPEWARLSVRTTCSLPRSHSRTT